MQQVIGPWWQDHQEFCIKPPFGAIIYHMGLPPGQTPFVVQAVIISNEIAEPLGGGYSRYTALSLTISRDSFLTVVTNSPKRHLLFLFPSCMTLAK